MHVVEEDTLACAVRTDSAAPQAPAGSSLAGRVAAWGVRFRVPVPPFQGVEGGKQASAPSRLLRRFPTFAARSQRAPALGHRAVPTLPRPCCRPPLQRSAPRPSKQRQRPCVRVEGGRSRDRAAGPAVRTGAATRAAYSGG